MLYQEYLIDIILKSEVHPTTKNYNPLYQGLISSQKVRYIQRTENYTLWYRGGNHLKK